MRLRLFITFDWNLHLVTFLTITLDAEGILGIVTGAAGAAGFHLGHRNGLFAGLEREQSGMAIGTFVHAKMEFVAEFHFTAVVFEGYGGGLESLVAFIAVAGRSERFFIVVAGTAGLALVHLSHGEMFAAGFIGERLGVALLAAEHGSVDRVSEEGWFNPFHFEGDVFRFHSHMAFATIAGNGKGFCAVMTGAASSALFHLRHGYAPALAGYDFAIMTAFAFTAHFGVMNDVAENGVTSSRNFIGYIT